MSSHALITSGSLGGFSVGVRSFRGRFAASSPRSTASAAWSLSPFIISSTDSVACLHEPE